MVAIFFIPNIFMVINTTHCDQNRPKCLVKIHNKYKYIEMLCLMTI